MTRSLLSRPMTVVRSRWIVKNAGKSPNPHEHRGKDGADERT